MKVRSSVLHNVRCCSQAIFGSSLRSHLSDSLAAELGRYTATSIVQLDAPRTPVLAEPERQIDASISRDGCRMANGGASGIFRKQDNSPGDTEMTHANAKQRALDAVAALPEDATFEDAMERLYFLAKVEKGLAQADAGELIPHDEVEARFASDAP